MSVGLWARGLSGLLLLIIAAGVAAFFLHAGVDDLERTPARPPRATTYSISHEHQVLVEEGAETGSVPIGATVDLPTMKTTDGQVLDPSKLLAQGPLAFVFVGTRCAVSQRYTQRLNRLRDELSAAGATIVAVASNMEDSLADLRSFAADMGYRIPAVKDRSGEIARSLGATMTPQAFVVDRNGTLRYRGAIDNQRYEPRVRDTFLKDALRAVLADREPLAARTPTFGCWVHLPTAPAPGAEITYADHVAPILWENCAPCHRPGEVAPFSLLTYHDAATWAREIAIYTRTRRMPPWRAVAGYGQFENERRLTDEEIELLSRWASDGTPSGDLAGLRIPERWTDGSTHEEPDAILEMARAYEIAPEGEDEYRDFVIPTNFDHDVFVSSIRVVPGSSRAVHHANLVADTTGEAREEDLKDDAPGFPNSMEIAIPRSTFGKISAKLRRLLPWREPPPRGQVFIGGWLPGMSPTSLPEGTGFLLPKGSDVVLQMHYHRTGKVEHDRSRVLMYFTTAPEPTAVHLKNVRNRLFEIPAGVDDYEVQAQGRFDKDVYVVAITPHMHLIGTDMDVSATLPNGDRVPLIRVENWDADWQETYRYRELLFLPAGTVVDVEAVFDNSRSNPKNPHDPPIPIGFGPETTDEMCIARLFYVDAAEYDAGREGMGTTATARAAVHPRSIAGN